MTALVTADVVFAESPRWHQDRLWFSDVHDYALKTVDAAGRLRVVTAVPGRPAGLGVLPDGRMLMATGLRGAVYAVTADGDTTLVADLADRKLGLLNDMVVTPDGTAYLGDTGFKPADGEAFRPGCVWMLAPDAEPRVVADDLAFPNGCAITADGTTLYFAETFGKRISRFTIGPDGSLSDRTVHVELDDNPDGLCVDAEGSLWVACVHSGVFARYGADGELRETLRAEGALAVTCVLGGPSRRRLFLCSADTTLERLARGDSRARIDFVDVRVAGAGVP